MITPATPFFVFDVESIGLHGEGFAVAGGIYISGAAQREFFYWCSPEFAQGTLTNLRWVRDNIPPLPGGREVNPYCVRHSFWLEWEKAKQAYPGIHMAAECGWPVEANFLSMCIRDANPFGCQPDPWPREFQGPYPLHEIATFMLAAGMDPMATYDRTPPELPKHNPLADARQSARLLHEALTRLNTPNCRLFP